MIRLVVRVTDANDLVHVGGPLRTYIRTFDIDHPTLEAALRGSQDRFTTGDLIGAEVLDLSQGAAS